MYLIMTALAIGALPMLLVLWTVLAPPPACNPTAERHSTLGDTLLGLGFWIGPFALFGGGAWLTGRGARAGTWLRPLGALALAALALLWALLAMVGMSFATLC